VERTLCIIKPDAVERNLIGKILARLEKEGFKITGMRMLQMSKEQAEGFYQVHQDKAFFQPLTDYMSSGPSVIMVLEAENVIERLRNLMGATDPAKAEHGTIRKEFAISLQKNSIHGSDSQKTAAEEIAYFESILKIQDNFI
jgi:nucleoside-diphosphate kinase